MNNHDSIPENTASQLAGVSANTLCRFVEAGYLKVQNDINGGKIYSKSEICKLFAIDENSPQNDPYLSNSIQVTNEESYYTEPDHTDSYPSSADPQNEESPPVPEKIYWADTLTPDKPDHAPSDSEKDDALMTENPKQSAEISRLRNITMMQDKILELRENEIEELKKEREWLKTRIEKLEEKSERDQILLLAETQTIKRLVNLTHQKKPSSMRLALEWLGLVPQTKDVQLNNSKIIE